MGGVILRHLKGSRAQAVEAFSLGSVERLVIGRGPDAAVRFEPDGDAIVSRRHACIARDLDHPRQFKVVDLDSRNGTFLNKRRIVGEMRLRPGDVIQLGPGGPELQFDIVPVPAAVTSGGDRASPLEPDRVH